MWLKDFLPNDVPHARILTFGYDCFIGGPMTATTLQDCVNEFKEKLMTVQKTSHVGILRQNLPILSLIISSNSEKTSCLRWSWLRGSSDQEGKRKSSLGLY